MSNKRKTPQGVVARPDLLISKRRTVDGREEKKCSKCKRWYPVEDFWDNPNKYDGKMGMCRFCWKRMTKKTNKNFWASTRGKLKNRINRFKEKYGDDPDTVEAYARHICAEMNYSYEELITDKRFKKKKEPERKFYIVNGEVRYLD